MPAETHSHRTPWSVDELRLLVLDRLAETVAVEPDALGDGLSLEADLGLADLGRLALIEVIEEEVGERTVGFALDDDDLAECVTVADLIECVVGRVGALDVGGGAEAT